MYNCGICGQGHQLVKDLQIHIVKKHIKSGDIYGPSGSTHHGNRSEGSPSSDHHDNSKETQTSYHDDNRSNESSSSDQDDETFGENQGAAGSCRLSISQKHKLMAKRLKTSVDKDDSKIIRKNTVRKRETFQYTFKGGYLEYEAEMIKHCPRISHHRRVMQQLQSKVSQNITRSATCQVVNSQEDVGIGTETVQSDKDVQHSESESILRGDNSVDKTDTGNLQFSIKSDQDVQHSKSESILRGDNSLDKTDTGNLQFSIKSDQDVQHSESESILRGDNSVDKTDTGNLQFSIKSDQDVQHSESESILRGDNSVDKTDTENLQFSIKQEPSESEDDGEEDSTEEVHPVNAYRSDGLMINNSMCQETMDYDEDEEKDSKGDNSINTFTGRFNDKTSDEESNSYPFIKNDGGSLTSNSSVYVKQEPLDSYEPPDSMAPLTDSLQAGISVNETFPIDNITDAFHSRTITGMLGIKDGENTTNSENSTEIDHFTDIRLHNSAGSTNSENSLEFNNQRIPVLVYFTDGKLPIPRSLPKDTNKSKRKPNAEIKDTDKPYKCDICSKSYVQASGLMSHMRVHSGDKPFACDFCEKAFKDKGDLFVHRRVHTGERPHCCDICGKSFSQLGNMQKHRRIHTGEKPYQCDVCSKQFRRSDDMAIHRTRHEILMLNCEICGKTFNSRFNLQRHMKVHTGVRAYKCEECGKGYYHASSLKLHVESTHNQRSHKCEICGKLFSLPGVLKKHLLIHSGVKPFECDVCGKLFRQQSNLMSHTYIHTGDRPFECSYCQKCFSRASDMKKHMLYHSETRPKKGKSSRNMPYKCSYCGRSFKHAKHWEKHTLTHTAEEIEHLMSQQHSQEVDIHENNVDI